MKKLFIFVFFIFLIPLRVLAEDYKITWRYVSKDMIHKRESIIQQEAGRQTVTHSFESNFSFTWRMHGSSNPIVDTRAMNQIKTETILHADREHPDFSGIVSYQHGDIRFKTKNLLSHLAQLLHGHNATLESWVPFSIPWLPAPFFPGVANYPYRITTDQVSIIDSDNHIAYARITAQNANGGDDYFHVFLRHIKDYYLAVVSCQLFSADEVQKMTHIWHDMACLGGSSLPLERGDPAIFCGEPYQLTIIPQSIFERISGVTATSVPVEGASMGATPMASDFTTRGQPCAELQHSDNVPVIPWSTLFKP